MVSICYYCTSAGTSRTIDDIIKPGEALDWEEDKGWEVILFLRRLGQNEIDNTRFNK